MNENKKKAKISKIIEYIEKRTKIRPDPIGKRTKTI